MSKQNDLKNLNEPNSSMSIDDLFRGIINEYRLPIMRIKGFCQILLSPETGSLTERQKDLLTLVIKDIEKMESGTNTYLNLYRETQQTEE